MSAIENVGPFRHHVVSINGWSVPFLTAGPAEDGGVYLSPDNRACLNVALDEEAAVVPFIADSVAVGLGYTFHPGSDAAGPNPRSPYHRLHGLEIGK